MLVGEAEAEVEASVARGMSEVAYDPGTGHVCALDLAPSPSSWSFDSFGFPDGVRTLLGREKRREGWGALIHASQWGG